MRRREMLAASSAALLGASTFPLKWIGAAEKKPKKLLYFTRSVEYEHSVISPREGDLSFSASVLVELGKKAGFEVQCTKDGRVFDSDLDACDAVVCFLCGNMFKPSVRKAPPMSADGHKRLIDAVAGGKPFVGLHSSCYWGRDSQPDDPYLAMVGGDFIAHGAQQKATMRVTAPDFPGAADLGGSFQLMDEWYAMKNFAKDLHVVLVQETQGMKGPMYQRPPFPATWARMHGEGRVFYSSMGHREDVWTNKTFQQILLGGIAWALGNVDADITPNIDKVAPKAQQYPS